MNKKIHGQLIDFGFQVPEQKIEDHIFGGGFGDVAVLNPSGQYDDFKPQYEPQADNFETQGCTVWGTENALEFLHRFKFGVEKNYEELPPYIGAGLHPDRGGDPNKVIQWIRDNGLVEAPAYSFPAVRDALLPLLGSPLPQFIVDWGQKWLTQYEVRHQWVLQGAEGKAGRIEAIKSALPYGVVGVSVTAWFTNEEGIYVDNGMRNTHWCVCYGWTDKGWKIFDSYDHSEKIYSFDARIDFAKLYFLDKKLTATQKKSLWDLIKSFWPFGEEKELQKLEPIFMPTETKAKEELIALVKTFIGQDASPNNLANKEVGCAESASNILNTLNPKFPGGIISTQNLKVALDKSPLFKRTLEPKAGCVVISPRTEEVNGHVGFLITDSRIVSNDSETGLMQDNYSWKNWVKTFKTGRGLHVYLYELV